VRRCARCAELGLDRFAERCAEQEAAVVPTPLVERHRPDAGLAQCLGNAQPMQKARCVRPDIDAGADLAERPRLLVDPHVKAGSRQRRRGRKPADAAADDRDRGHAAP
jgi:hypothetical protein